MQEEALSTILPLNYLSTFYFSLYTFLTAANIYLSFSGRLLNVEGNIQDVPVLQQNPNYLPPERQHL